MRVRYFVVLASAPMRRPHHTLSRRRAIRRCAAWEFAEMIKTKAELARHLDALQVGQPLTDWWLLLPRLFGHNGRLDARGVKAARAFAAQHDCILSYPEFSREPVLFEKLMADGQLAPYVASGRREPGLRRRASSMLEFNDGRRIVDTRWLRRGNQRRSSCHREHAESQACAIRCA
jgi:hypothetical protein